MPRPIVFDTSAIILSSRQAASRPRIATLSRGRRSLLPSIVVGELFAGTRSREEADSLERFVAHFVREGLVLVPDFADWKLAGQLIARRSRLVGELGPRDHRNDVLISIVAARVGGAIYTANPRHLSVWTEMPRSSGLDAVVTPLTVS